jgi:hypothetical protein
MERMWLTFSYKSEVMVIGFLSIWCFLSNALFCVGFVVLLEGSLWQERQCRDLESCSFVLNAELVEINKHVALREKSYTR